jgi:holo-[acyl-carrier protein] synthase
VGIDVVSIPDFAEQVDQPGTVFAETFTPGERRDAADKSSVAARHLAARWAAKEAVIKAWSGSRFAQRRCCPRAFTATSR